MIADLFNSSRSADSKYKTMIRCFCNGCIRCSNCSRYCDHGTMKRQSKDILCRPGGQILVALIVVHVLLSSVHTLTIPSSKPAFMVETNVITKRCFRRSYQTVTTENNSEGLASTGSTKQTASRHNNHNFGRLSLRIQMSPSSTTEENELKNITDTKVEAFFMKDNSSNASPTNAATSTTSESQQQPKEVLVDNLTKAAWQMGSDFFVALRWGAANALTAALPDNQRQILLERMDPTIPAVEATALVNQQQQPQDINVLETTTATDDGYEKVTNSINEAVVASMVAKTQKDEMKWEKEKEKILAQAEIAAQKRVETELAIQQQRYEIELQRLAAIEKAAANNEDDDDDEEEDDDDDTKAEVRHPVLGPVLYDFGYKRLHLVPADILATIPVWKKQRTFRQERAKSMSIDKMKTLHLGFPGVICIHEERSTGKIAIIDGQHRVGMMKILQEKQKQVVVVDGDSGTASTGLNFIDLDHILVEVYTETEPYSSSNTKASSLKEVSGLKDHAQDLFTEINKAEPVKLVDMPGVATGKERKMISQACNKFEEQYTVMFRPSQKCRPPNVNIDNLRDTIFASNILKRHDIQTSSQLYDWLLLQNKQMGIKYTTDTKLQSSLNEKVWSKAQTNEFYLGLDSSWLYN